MVVGELAKWCVVCKESHKGPRAIAVGDRCPHAVPWVVLDPRESPRPHPDRKDPDA